MTLHRTLLPVALSVGCAPLLGGSTTSSEHTGGGGDSAEPPTWSCPLAVPEPALTCADTPDPLALDACATSGAAALVSGNPFATVADAVASAAAGDVVVVCPGTWDGTFVVAQALTIEAADPTPGATVLEPADVDLDAEVTLRGLTLRGGATLVQASAPATLECLVVAGATNGGVVAEAPLVVRDSLFRGNEARHNGGALVAEEGLVVEDSHFVGNRSGYAGGAIQARGEASLRRSGFVDNSADYEGGAVAWGDRDPYTLVIEDVDFACNATNYEGGALDVGSWGQDTVTLRRTTFRANSARYEGAAVTFGSWGSIDATIEDTRFEGNVGARGTLDVGGWQDNGADLRLVRVWFTDNVAASGASAIAVGSRVPRAAIEAETLVVRRNTGGVGALELNPATTFTCTSCDFGSGADDNLPADTWTGDALGSDFTL